MANYSDLLQQIVTPSSDPFSANNPSAVTEAGVGQDWQAQSPGIFKRRNASGTMEFTNVVGDNGDPTMGKGTPTIQSQPGGMVGGSPNNPGIPDIQKQLDVIAKTPDVATKQSLFMDLQNQVAQQQAFLVDSIRKQAEMKVGVSVLEKQLATNEAQDRQHPMWATQQSDSKQTEDVRNNLNTARAVADRETAQLIRANPQLAMIEQQMKGASSLIDYNMRLADRQQGKADVLQDKTEAVMSAIGPEAKDAIWTLRPDLKGNDAATAQFTMQELKMNKKDWEPILSGMVKPEDLFLTGLAGNKVAASLAVKKQIETTGMPEATVAKQARVLNDFVTNPMAADKLIKDFNLLPSSKELQAYQGLGLKGNAQGQADQIKARLMMVNTLASRMAISDINNNIDKWPVTPGTTSLVNLPEAGAIFDASKRIANRAPTVQEFYDSYVNADGIAPDERTRRSEIVRGAYNATLKKASSGIYGTDIDVVGLTNKLAIRGAFKMPEIQSWR